MLLSISRLMIDTVQDLDWSFMEIYFAKQTSTYLATYLYQQSVIDELYW